MQTPSSNNFAHNQPGLQVTGEVIPLKYLDQAGGVAGDVPTIIAGSPNYITWVAGGVGSGITSLTGDVTATGPGAAAATISANVITDAMVNASAGISFSKLATLTSANILVGSVANVATSVTMSKDGKMSNTGQLTVVGLQGNTVLASTPDIGGALIYDGTFWGSNPVSSLLFTLIGANMNTTADQAMVGPVLAGTAFVITDIVIKNASVSLTTADTGGFWSGAAQSGSHYAELDTASLAKLTANTKFISLAQEQGAGVAGAAFSNDVAGTSVIFSLGTAQGAAATADILVYGYVLA